MIAIADLGEWWENMTLLPVPLGAILVRDDVGDDEARALDAAIRRSLAFARANDDAVMPYVRAHAAEMSDDVMRAHIDLYVNEFSDDLGEVGHEAVRALFASRARRRHLASNRRATIRMSARGLRRAEFLAGAGAFGIAAAGRAVAQPLPPAAIALGDDVFLRSAWRDLHGRSVGVITNQSGVTSGLVSIVDAILDHGGIRLKAIYAPEHGFRGDRGAGASVASYVDPQTHLPVYSLYGASRHPSAAMLDGIDVLLFDIQDVGARAYTYISTMAYAMQSAHDFGKEFWVLDRPNPTGGTIVEGPVLEKAFESFIGLYPIADRHGMTVGELAGLFNDYFGIGAKLRVVRMEGWRRSMLWPDTGLQWVMTSPNIPEWQTTIVYPGTGLIDGLGINNGSGFTKPFFLAGTAGIDGGRLADRLNGRNLPGVWFRPAAWSPLTGFWQSRELTGVELIVFDPRRFYAVRTAVEISVAIRDLFPRAIQIKSPSGLDRDWGTDTLSPQLHRRSERRNDFGAVASADGRVRNAASQIFAVLTMLRERLVEALGAGAVKTEPEDLAVYSFDAYTDGGRPSRGRLAAIARATSAPSSRSPAIAANRSSRAAREPGSAAAPCRCRAESSSRSRA